MATAKKGSGARGAAPRRKKDETKLEDGWKPIEPGPCVVCGKKASFQDPEGRRRHDGCKIAEASKPEFSEDFKQKFARGEVPIQETVGKTSTFSFVKEEPAAAEPEKCAPGCHFGDKDEPKPKAPVSEDGPFTELRRRYRELRTYFDREDAEFDETRKLTEQLGQELAKLEEWHDGDGKTFPASAVAAVITLGAKELIKAIEEEKVDRKGVIERLKGTVELGTKLDAILATERSEWMAKADRARSLEYDLDTTTRELDEAKKELEENKKILDEHEEKCLNDEQLEDRDRETLRLVFRQLVPLALDRGASPVDVWVNLEPLAADEARRECDKYVPGKREEPRQLGFAPAPEPYAKAPEELPRDETIVLGGDLEEPEAIVRAARDGSLKNSPVGWTLAVGKGACVICGAPTAGRYNGEWKHYDAEECKVRASGELKIETLRGGKVVKTETLPNVIVPAPEPSRVACKADREEEPAPAATPAPDFSTLLGDF